MSQKLAILDAGSQFAKIIDRKIRELSVESQLLPMDTPIEKLKQYRAIIISGGPGNLSGEDAVKYDPKLFELNKPMLGVCYGMQLISYVHGGKIEKKDIREDGQFFIDLDLSCSLFKNMRPREKVLLTHGDSVEVPGKGFSVVARSGDLIAAIENKDKKWYGVQFHPEVDLTINGKKVFSNFLFEIAGFDGSYTMENREEKALKEIKKRVGDKKALILVSGGVDSTVCAALVTKAIGSENVIALHIDTGFMRLNESKKVFKALTKFGLKLKVIHAAETFYNAKTKIDGKETPKLNEAEKAETKRKIIGDTFMRIAGQEIEKLGLKPEEVFLVQGSLRPDLIESASTHISGNATTIKTHHNDTQLVRELREQGRVIEPLGEYHKDEVRSLGEDLGLPEEINWRQPFPGPGLAIRIICSHEPYMTTEFDEINQKLQKDFSDDKIAATLLPIQTVGIQGDGRTYSYAVALSGSSDWKELFKRAKTIPKIIHQVNRVIYVFGKKVTNPLKSITTTHLELDTIVQLQQADDIANQTLLKYGLLRSLSQVPVISFPVDFGEKGTRSIAIRTFITNDFMTGVPAVPGKEMPIKALEEIVERILKEVPGISRVAYDLTSKPPGTTEWE